LHRANPEVQSPKTGVQLRPLVQRRTATAPEPKKVQSSTRPWSGRDAMASAGARAYTGGPPPAGVQGQSPRWVLRGPPEADEVLCLKQ